ncbi:MAG: RNA polymerase sigma factor [Actinobacteria bacterium]|nr:RNA polymerase sigma factor [Actinomycetota bacterium]
MLSDIPFDQIVARARAGDAAAWADLYDEVGGLVVGYLRSQRLPDPEDVAGEVFLQMVRDIHRFDGDREKFRSWVLSIAHNRLVDDRRRARRRPSTPVPPDDLRSTPATSDALPEHELLRQLATDEVEVRLARLTEEQRTVVMLRVVGDLSLKECAEVMGKRVGAIKGLQHRAVETLRRELGGESPVHGAENARDVRSTPTRPSSDPSA